MKNELTVNNLVASYYDNGLHELEFNINGTTVFVRNIKEDVNGNEYYWDDPINVKRVIDEADETDIIKKGMNDMRKAIIKEVRDLTIQEQEVLLESAMLRDDIMEFARESESLYVDDMFDCVKPYLLDYSIDPYGYSYMKVNDIPGFIEGVNDMNNDFDIIDNADVLETLELAIEASDVYTGVTMYSDIYHAIQDILESYINDIVEYLIKEFVGILDYYDNFEKVEMESDYVTYYLEIIFDSECLIDGNKVTLI